MRFNSRKDILYQGITYGLTGVFLVFVINRIVSNGMETYKFVPSDLVLLLLLIPLLWAQFTTKYELNNKELKYHSGPIRGKIEIEKIREIIKGKTLWAGLKPAIARNGLIIKYDKYDEIYISPESNDMFVNKILEINPNIKIIEIKN